jgi:hypothetical protein
LSNTRTTSPRLLREREPDQPSLLALLVEAFDGAMSRQAWQPGCARCVARAKRGGTLTGVNQAVTWQDGEPVCFTDFEIAGG